MWLWVFLNDLFIKLSLFDVIFYILLLFLFLFLYLFIYFKFFPVIYCPNKAKPSLGTMFQIKSSHNKTIEDLTEKTHSLIFDITSGLEYLKFTKKSRHR